MVIDTLQKRFVGKWICHKVSRTFRMDASFGKYVLVENTTLCSSLFPKKTIKVWNLRSFWWKAPHKISKQGYNNKYFPVKPCCFKRKLHNFPAIVQQNFLYSCRFKATKELRVALISVSHTTPKRWPCFISTDMRKRLKLKISTLIQTQIRQLSGHRSTKVFAPMCSYIYICNCNTQGYQWGICDGLEIKLT